ncbi:MAG: type I DNA topoisomerase [Patescibacteria group bacterium]|nr:type I DNA topoisomerase [Patescibacteria group bacterium]
MKLVIVESPTKAKTITKFLGKDYKVMASMGHVRDLPKSKLGVDVENNFEPQYLIPREHKAKVKELKDIAKKADEIYFATDEDREGEAISWHLAQILDEDPEKLKRITFHEITKEAILNAVKNPRALDLKLVDAQQARRILDRLVGYQLSPFLWRHMKRGLSAGRVQSVAVRLIVERERVIQDFKPEEYWSIEGSFLNPKDQALETKLQGIKGKALDKMEIKDQKQADEIIEACKKESFKISNIEQKEKSKAPPAPFTTSSLQQEANNKLGFSAKQTMTLAQKLYEGLDIGSEGSAGLITYMRTDSLNLSQKFIEDATGHIVKTFGKEMALDKPRVYKTKSKGAQEAHEAIRPTDPTRTPESLEPYLDKNMLRLYTLIWQRSVATQMVDAKLNATRIDITGGDYNFRATGQQVVKEGYLKLYPDQEKDKLLPEVSEGEKMTAKEIKGNQHFTEPPARYSDATLVKALEENGIGRPSTYAPTISTIIDRGYIERDDKKRLQPTEIASEVTDMLVQRFPDVVDVDFTARMESSLDHIAEGDMNWRPLIQAFYGPFHLQLEKQEAELDAVAQKEAEGEVCDKCGKPMLVKHGRFGKFLACTGYPECKSTRPMAGQDPLPEPEPTDEKCPTCESPMVKKVGRYGPFLACSKYPECKTIVNIEIPALDQNGNDITCPKCKQGRILERKSKRGKLFFSCNRYPECDQAFWDKPTGEPCPECKYPTLVKRGKTIYCPDKDNCKYKTTIELE